LHVVVTRDDEESIHPELEPLHQTLEEAGGSLVLIWPPPIGDVTGKANQIYLPVLQQLAEIVLPSITENPPPPPRLVFSVSALVEIGDVKDAKGVVFMLDISPYFR
jgi:hypothetical protein